MPDEPPRLPAPGDRPNPNQSLADQAAAETPAADPAAAKQRRGARAPRGTLPAFTPVPRIHNRHTGWTPERQQGFIEALADLGSVKAAAQRVGMTAEGAYMLRRHAEAGEFRRAWEAALKCGVQRLEDIAMERALNGVEVPVYHFGEIVGTRRVHNDRLLMFLLRNRAHRRFAADSLAHADAATQGQLKRLKRDWRAEWDAERAAADTEAQRESEEILQSINAKLEKMRQARLQAMSPETRALERAFQAGLRRDRAAGLKGGFDPDPEEDAPGDPPRLPAPPDPA